MAQPTDPPSGKAGVASPAAGGLAAPRCSEISRALDEPLIGTAPVASSWLVLEQPGPWGRQAVLDSRLDPALGAVLMDLATEHDGRFALARRPAPARDPDQARRRPLVPHGRVRFWIASTLPGSSWLATGRVKSARELLELDWVAFAEGDRDRVRASGPALTPESEPLVLVCTNGRRDRCCAIAGRPLATQLAATLGDRVWETNHTGGHRFAPTCVVLPWGLSYGRVDPALAARVVQEGRAGRLLAEGLRGRSCHDPAGQVAEAAVRLAIDDWDLDSLRVLPVTQVSRSRPTSVEVGHRDGRRWTVSVVEAPLEPPRPESCGKEDVRPSSWQVAGPVQPSRDDPR